MANETALINGEAYVWNNIKVTLLGRTLEGITAVKYDDKQDKANNPGGGKLPVTRGQGKYEATCSLTLQLEEIQALQLALPAKKRLMDISRFNIVVSYLTEDQRVIIDTIRGCEFMDNGRDVKSGDMVIERELNIICTEIIWG